jgi:hypothetical protein
VTGGTGSQTRTGLAMIMPDTVKYLALFVLLTGSQVTVMRFDGSRYQCEKWNYLANEARPNSYGKDYPVPTRRITNKYDWQRARGLPLQLICYTSPRAIVLSGYRASGF